METTNITSLVYISTKKTDTQEVNTDFKITLSLPQTLWLGERTGLMITPGLDYQTWGEYIYKAECISWRVSVKKYMNSKGFLLLQLQIQRSYSFCCVLFLVAQSYLTICDPIDCSPPGSSVHGDSSGKNTRAMPSSRGSSQLRDQIQVSCTVGGFFAIWATGEAPSNWQNRTAESLSLAYKIFRHHLVWRFLFPQ